MDKSSRYVSIWLVVLLPAIAEEPRVLGVMETPDIPRQPARSASTPDNIFKQQTCATEPLPFLYQG